MGVSGAMAVNLDINSIKATGTGQDDLHSRSAQIRDAAKQFEAFFLSYVLKQMQTDSLESGLFGAGLGKSTYTEMFTDELAKVMAEGRGIGLADQLTRQLEAGILPSKPPDSEKHHLERTPLTTNREGVPSAGLPQPAALDVRRAALDFADVPAADRTLGSSLRLPGLDPAAQIDAADADTELPLEEGSITSDFGMRLDPFSGRRRFHRGIDIAAERGAPIKAAASGRVVFSGRQGGYGNTVVIEHANGYKTQYAHADSFSVRAGEYVEAGQIVGTVGSTGRSTGPHLHFEVTRNGEHLNPGEIFSLK